MKKQLTIGVAILLAVLFTVVGVVIAAAPEVLQMNDSRYKKHTKKIVTFTHKKHADDYKIACGECHHDDNGKPLELKADDPVQKCGDCHSTFGKTAKSDRKMKKKDKIKKYQKEALHANCIGCHKKQKKGPKKCAECHPKKKKK